ncbi:3510_t:CDS:2 [Entrophospora sp. SA101]|nr:3510_t:CDS:2 [Entrophospora sp. SA101]CAJ0832153.1 8784_t:CDS:2 [Entrophospora sp. SA101]CAJ0837587.1 260_t:CDS:2 [Entrophospora sp. SA101]CAJ0867610.1 10974_t:CDS:2 [Entrophospora sp. SA101]
MHGLFLTNYVIFLLKDTIDERIIDNGGDDDIRSSAIQKSSSATISTPKSNPIYSAVYYGVPVYVSFLEILTGEHEKVQGGYGKYQGTWIPFEKGKELATKYGALESLCSILGYMSPEYDTPYLSSPYTPTKEQAMAALHIESAAADNSSSPEIGESEQLGNILMAIFLSEKPELIQDLLVTQYSSEPDINMVIDSRGNSAIHWAACLGRLKILEMLLNRGANMQQVNYDGETALIRSVFVTNNYDSQSFSQVVKLFHDTIPITDKDN